MGDYGDDKYSVYRKLMEVQRNVRSIAKDANNKKMGFPFASSTAVLTAIRHQMDEIGLLLIFDVKRHDVEKDTAYNGKQSLTILDVEATWVDAENPESQLSVMWPGQGADDGEKGVGKAMTYMEKYGMLKFFHIPTDEVDPDADASPEVANAHKCSKCGRVMRLIDGKSGKFWGCTGYPKCKSTMPFETEESSSEDTPGSYVYSSDERPEESVDISALWEATWEVIRQVRGEEAGPEDAATVAAMKKWAKARSEGEIEELEDWPPSMILAFKSKIASD